MIIIRDIQEKVGYWEFEKYDECEGCIDQHLETGDYQIYNSKKIVVDRKKTTGELSTNLGTKFKQFENECRRMKEFEQRFIICEFSLKTIIKYPKNSRIPRNKLKYIKMNPKFMLNQINKLEEEYNVKFIFCKNKQDAEQTALELFKKVE